MEDKLVQLRYMVITALFVNYKLSEDPIMRSTLDELLKPLAIKELKGFMLLLTKTPRKFRSVLELVADVVEEIQKSRFDQHKSHDFIVGLHSKLEALLSFAKTEISGSSFDTEIAFLKTLDITKLKEKESSLFDKRELYVIENIGFISLISLFNDDPYLFEKRILDALYLYDTEAFNTQHSLSSGKKNRTLEDVNRPEIVEALAHDKRV